MHFCGGDYGGMGEDAGVDAERMWRGLVDGCIQIFGELRCVTCRYVIRCVEGLASVSDLVSRWVSCMMS